MRVPYNSLIKTAILTIMIFLLTLTTYGANWKLVFANSLVIFILALFSNLMGDLVLYYFRKRKELRSAQINSNKGGVENGRR